MGHLGAVQLLDRAMWQVLGAGPGWDVFERDGLTPRIRQVVVSVMEEVKSGEILRFDISISSDDEAAMVRESARRASDGVVVVEGEFKLTCQDPAGNAKPLPEALRQTEPTASQPEAAAQDSRQEETSPEVSQKEARPSRRGSTRSLAVRGFATSVDVQGDGQALLLIHGFPFDRTLWRHQLATLSGWRRVAPDLRGMGLSDGPEKGYSMEEYAADLVSLLDLLGNREAVVCGLSMGGYIAFEMLRRFPERVKGLILVNTRASADSADAKERRTEMISLLDKRGPSAVVDALLPKLLAPGSLSTMKEVVDHIKEMAAGGTRQGLRGALVAMKERVDSTPDLGSIKVPCLVIAGSEDQLIPVKEQRKMAKAIDGAVFTVIPGAGHVAPLEQPIAVSRVMGEFLEALS